MDRPPLKRQRTDEVIDRRDDWEPVAPSGDDGYIGKFTREADVGITEFVSHDFEGFDCILKYKYSDFMVNEVGLDEKVVELRDTNYLNSSNNQNNGAKKDKNQNPALTTPDLTPLSDLFSAEQVAQLNDLYMSKGVSPSEVTTDVLSKDQRTQIHHIIRHVFSSKLDSQATSTGSVRITYPKAPTRRNTSKWSEGEYCHFTIKKQNRDTMATASILSKWLKCHNKVIGYAGTKDRRAVTTQRMSAFRVRAERLASLNQIGNPLGVWIGDFRYAQEGIKLGDLKGNKFTITLREIPSSTDLDAIGRAMKALQENGFINYYGMQRFGTGLVLTHTVGALLLNGQWKDACEAILDVKGGGMNDSLLARELYAKGDIEGAFEAMPRSCIAERAALGVLKNNPKHYSGALQAIPRNLRLMYVHAYQSYVWNVVASARMRLSSTGVLEGDLVLVNSTQAEEPDIEDPDAGTEFTLPDTKKEESVGVRALTAEDVASGTYSINDIVLPTPGYDVTYPDREELREAYIDTMSRDGLDPFNMRRVVREISLFGHYRRLVHRPEDVDWGILRYNGRDTLLDTDAVSNGGEYMALRLQLRLGTSQYATMALREICKRDSGLIQYWGRERDELEKAKKLEVET